MPWYRETACCSCSRIPWWVRPVRDRKIVCICSFDERSPLASAAPCLLGDNVQLCTVVVFCCLLLAESTRKQRGNNEKRQENRWWLRYNYVSFWWWWLKSSQIFAYWNLTVVGVNFNGYFESASCCGEFCSQARYTFLHRGVQRYSRSQPGQLLRFVTEFTNRNVICDVVEGVNGVRKRPFFPLEDERDLFSSVLNFESGLPKNKICQWACDSIVLYTAKMRCDFIFQQLLSKKVHHPSFITVLIIYSLTKPKTSTIFSFFFK